MAKNEMVEREQHVEAIAVPPLSARGLLYALDGAVRHMKSANDFYAKANADAEQESHALLLQRSGHNHHNMAEAIGVTLDFVAPTGKEISWVDVIKGAASGGEIRYGAASVLYTHPEEIVD